MKVPALEPGSYLVFVDDGTGERITTVVTLQVAIPTAVGTELSMKNLPDALFADECQQVQIGFSTASGDFGLPPLVAGESYVEVVVDPGRDEDPSTVDGLVISSSSGCPATEDRPFTVRLTARAPVAAFYVRGRTPDVVPLTAQAFRSSGALFSTLSRELRVRGKVRIRTFGSRVQVGRCVPSCGRGSTRSRP
ncbi:MAG: hypothetical protein HC923_05125, partial [Myxococcales bacterium]|nr:hypothetical protein [Myxococcales bacterium]